MAYPKTISRGDYSLRADNEEQEVQLKDFLGIDPPGVDLDSYVGALKSVDEINEWYGYWVNIFFNWKRNDLITFLQSKAVEFIKKLEETITTEEVSPETKEGITEFVYTPKTEKDVSFLTELFKAVKIELGKTKIIPGVEVHIPVSAKIGAAFLTMGSLIGGTVGGVAIGTGIVISTVKAAAAVSGVDTIMVWMASDNILTGTAFTLRKLREAVKAGAVTEQRAKEEMDLVQAWINSATAFVKVSIELNPLILPFANILMINADKAQKDFDWEKVLIRKTFDKIKEHAEKERLKKLEGGK